MSSRRWKQIARYRKEARALGEPKTFEFVVIKITPITIGFNLSRGNIVIGS
jgi:hypothetical protein